VPPDTAVKTYVFSIIDSKASDQESFFPFSINETDDESFQFGSGENIPRSFHPYFRLHNRYEDPVLVGEIKIFNIPLVVHHVMLPNCVGQKGVDSNLGLGK